MLGFSKFNLSLKVDNKSYKCLHAIYVCEFKKKIAKITTFVNINRTQTFVDLQFTLNVFFSFASVRTFWYNYLPC